MALPAVVLDLAGKILAVNARAMRLGAREPDEVIGRYASDFAPGIEYLWDERLTAGRAPDGAGFEIAITTGRGALMLEYVVKVYELDGQPAVVALITGARPLT
jgi:PAS domain-containing protein